MKIPRLPGCSGEISLPLPVNRRQGELFSGGAFPPARAIPLRGIFEFFDCSTVYIMVWKTLWRMCKTSYYERIFRWQPGYEKFYVITFFVNFV